VLRITPNDGEPWDIAIGTPGWARTPSPTTIAVISDLTGCVLDVVERRVVFSAYPVIRITEDERHDLLLLVGFTSLTAVGRDGVAWTTEPLALDDLKVVAIREDVIVCTGTSLEYLADEIVVNAVTGARLSGPRL
jgi:hypothetical protein